MPDAFAILFDSDNVNGYFPGSWISGRVILTLRKPQRTRGLRLTFKGYEHTHWSTGSGKHRRTHTETVGLINTNLVMFGYPPGQSMADHMLPELPAGNSVYPFRLQIPNSFLPASIELSAGSIRYEICAYIDIVRWFDTYSPTYPIVIKNSLIVNTPNLLQPLSFNQAAMMGCFTNQGTISCVSSISKQGYLPGETVLVDSQITNSSKKTNITHVIASLAMFIEFRAHSSRKVVQENVANVVINELILPNSPARSLQHMLTIPNSMRYLSKLDSRLITISYAVQITVHTGGCGSNIVTRLPIVIGNTILNNEQPQTLYAPLPQEPLSTFEYTLENAQHPSHLDVELPPYTDIMGTESY